MPLSRLDAEALYDTLLFVAGKLDETRFGSPDAVQARPDGLITPAGTERGWRRLIYVRQARKQLPSHLETFDYPSMNPNCVERRDSTVAPQALHLLNNGMIHDLAGKFAARVAREAGNDRGKRIELVYLIALSRPPSETEMKIAREALGRLAEEWAKTDKPNAEEKALASFCHAIVNSAAFLYVD